MFNINSLYNKRGFKRGASENCSSPRGNLTALVSLLPVILTEDGKALPHVEVTLGSGFIPTTPSCWTVYSHILTLCPAN